MLKGNIGSPPTSLQTVNWSGDFIPTYVNLLISFASIISPVNIYFEPKNISRSYKKKFNSKITIVIEVVFNIMLKDRTC